MGFRVSGFGFRVLGLGFRIFGISGLGFRVEGLGSRGLLFIYTAGGDAARTGLAISTARQVAVQKTSSRTLQPFKSQKVLNPARPKP